MIEATSCGGVVIYHGKILTLFKNYKNKYEGWVLPKGTVEPGETFEQTALREVYEETGAKAKIVQFIGTSHYTLMKTDSYFSRPQREEYFVDSGYYKYHESFHLLKFSNERMMLERGYNMYMELKRKGRWDDRF